MEMLGNMRKAKNVAFQPQYAQCVTPERLLYHRHMVIISNTKTHQQSQIFQINEL
jgi:hypothetical protein